jgi:predicted GNAT family acetyltransferase
MTQKAVAFTKATAFFMIPLCVQYVENIYAKRQACAAFERRILQLIAK